MVVGIRSEQDDAGFFSLLIPEEYPRDGDDAAQCKYIVPDTEVPLRAALIFARYVEVLTVPPHWSALCQSNNLLFDQVDEHLRACVGFGIGVFLDVILFAFAVPILPTSLIEVMPSPRLYIARQHR